MLHSFGNGADGIEPAANLIDVKGRLYGTTFSGGAYDSGGAGGIVFSISTTGLERVLHNFGNGSDGEFPSANLLDVPLARNACYTASTDNTMAKNSPRA